MLYENKIKVEIYEGLNSKNFLNQIEAISKLSLLKGEEALEIAKEIIRLENNLGMKLEVLRILPTLFNQTNYKDISNILKLSISDNDSEVIRNTLLCLQKLPSKFLSKNLIRLVIKIIDSNDTDLQYQALITILHLRNNIPIDLLIKAITPLTMHSNETLSKKAKEAIDLISS